MNNRLRILRAEAGLSQGDLARLLGVSRQTVNAVETDKYDPSLPLALRMAKIFGVAVDGVGVEAFPPLSTSARAMIVCVLFFCVMMCLDC